ncbi:MAG: hypothetical protein AAGA37_05395 [Actinomycetota bacterium]
MGVDWKITADNNSSTEFTNYFAFHWRDAGWHTGSLPWPYSWDQQPMDTLPVAANQAAEVSQNDSGSFASSANDLIWGLSNSSQICLVRIHAPTVVGPFGKSPTYRWVVTNAPTDEPAKLDWKAFLKDLSWTTVKPAGKSINVEGFGSKVLLSPTVRSKPSFEVDATITDS